MTKKEEIVIDPGTVFYEAHRQAIYASLIRRKNISFVFNGQDYCVDLKTAKSKLPDLLKSTEEQFDSLKHEMNKQLDYLKRKMMEDIKLLQSLAKLD